MTDVNQTEIEMQKRWAELDALQKHYAEFSDFLYDCMTELMGFNCTEIQLDIGNYLQYGPVHMMIQAQRSQAKSSIVAIFAVWCLIHDPRFRILIVSAGDAVATEIANWVIQIIRNWDILSCLRPDRQHGDRSSSKAFDVHWQLKGAEKSPSVACIGVTANMQGRRADLLIPDDIESSKNGLTEIQRQALLHLSKDFPSICQNGRIVYLGTPQTAESVYNSLPARGYAVRIWPGRYPTQEQLDHYGDHLAPLIRRRLTLDPSLQTGGGVLGDQGQATDPELLGEAVLVSKELDQGAAYFQLQHMLNTKLTDENRYPLKAKRLVVMPLNLERAPGEISWMPDKTRRLKIPGHSDNIQLYSPWALSDETYEYEGRGMYVDPAGGGANGDETAAWITYFLHGTVFAVELLAMPGGFESEKFDALSDLAIKHRVNKIEVEENFGKGAFAQMWRPVLLKRSLAAGLPGATLIDDVWESGQKELRIINTVEPLLGRHKIVINEEVFEYDMQSVGHYPADKRAVYTFIHQFSKVTRERGALVHDDRIDAFSGAVRMWVDRIAVDAKTRMDQKVENQTVQMMAEWSEDFAKTVSTTKLLGNALTSIHSRQRRRRR